ncbi:MAG: AlpA family phage regulatory protein [Proteobacteria bacterium]|nr:AlpA family phage regulatory protein [Pseudomonadota bacterium]
MADERIIRDKEADGISGLKRSQRYRLEKENLFPQRRKLSPCGRATGYLLSELQTWVANRPGLLTPSTVSKIGSGKPGPGRGHKKSAAA